MILLFTRKKTSRLLFCSEVQFNPGVLVWLEVDDLFRIGPMGPSRYSARCSYANVGRGMWI